MPTPPFILRLREKIGHDPLWMSGVTAVCIRDGEVLLVRRSDNGVWTPICGIIEPGEGVGETVVRECFEEARVRVEVERLVAIGPTDPITYPNGDQANYLEHTCAVRWISGDPTVGDDESTDVQWFPLDALPEELSAHHRRAITDVASGRPGVIFREFE